MQARSNQHVRGIDVSKWQGKIDWSKVRSAGISFVMIKATEGTTVVDRYFKQNILGAQAVGIKVGAYHYAHPDNDPILEVDHFIKTITGFTLDLPPALDLEVNKGLNKKQVTSFAVSWLREIERRIGRKPLFYSYTSFIRSYIGKELEAWPLWIAHYEVLQPGKNGVWDQWMVFQYSSKGRIDGIEGDVDLNVMEESFLNVIVKGDDEYMLSKEDANKIIRFLSSGYYIVKGHKEAEMEFNRLANELRKASGQNEQ